MWEFVRVRLTDGRSSLRLRSALETAEYAMKSSCCSSWSTGLHESWFGACKDVSAGTWSGMSVYCCDSPIGTLPLPPTTSRLPTVSIPGSAINTHKQHGSRGVYHVLLPTGSKYSIFMDSGQQYHEGYGSWNQKPQILCTWIL